MHNSEFDNWKIASNRLCDDTAELSVLHGNRFFFTNCHFTQRLASLFSYKMNELKLHGKGPINFIYSSEKWLGLCTFVVRDRVPLAVIPYVRLNIILAKTEKCCSERYNLILLVVTLRHHLTPRVCKVKCNR